MMDVKLFDTGRAPGERNYWKVSVNGVDVGGSFSQKAMEELYEKLKKAASVPEEHGPDFHDGHDWEGFKGGCARLGCSPDCKNPDKALDALLDFHKELGQFRWMATSPDTNLNIRWDEAIDAVRRRVGAIIRGLGN